MIFHCWNIFFYEVFLGLQVAQLLLSVRAVLGRIQDACVLMSKNYQKTGEVRTLFSNEQQEGFRFGVFGFYTEASSCLPDESGKSFPWFSRFHSKKQNKLLELKQKRNADARFIVVTFILLFRKKENIWKTLKRKKLPPFQFYVCVFFSFWARSFFLTTNHNFSFSFLESNSFIIVLIFFFKFLKYLTFSLIAENSPHLFNSRYIFLFNTLYFFQTVILVFFTFTHASLFWICLTHRGQRSSLSCLSSPVRRPDPLRAGRSGWRFCWPPPPPPPPTPPPPQPAPPAGCPPDGWALHPPPVLPVGPQRWWRRC